MSYEVCSEYPQAQWLAVGNSPFSNTFYHCATFIFPGYIDQLKPFLTLFKPEQAFGGFSSRHPSLDFC
ncbi:MAG: hypothetical protein R3B47_13140 [Bacteroidia bacterium]